MKKIFFLILSLSIYSLFSQNIYVNRQYDFSNNNAAVLFGGILIDNDTFIVNGILTENDHPYKRKSFFTKLDSSGNTIQHTLIDSSDITYFWTYPKTITKAKDGGYFCSGLFDNSNADWNKGSLVKVNHNLDTLWIRRYSPDSSISGRVIVVANYELDNGNILLVCELRKFDNDMNVIEENMLLILTDSLGIEMKRKEWGVAYSPELPKGFLSSPWGLLAYGGNAWFASDNNKGGGYILNIDSLCNIQDTFICSRLDSVIWINSLALTSDSNLIACGIMTRLHPVTQEWSCLDYIAKYSPPPYQQLWQIRFQLADCEYSRFEKAVPTPDGGAVVCGGDYTLPVGNAKGWMIKVSKDGQIIWDRRHTLITGGEHHFVDMVRNADGGFTLAGYIYSNGGAIGTYGWLVRTDSFGCVVPGCQSVGIEVAENIAYKMLISPNPTTDFLNVYIAQKPDFKGLLRLYDTNGKVVMSGEVSGENTTYIFPVRGLASGMYYLEMSAEGSILQMEKVVKE